VQAAARSTRTPTPGRRSDRLHHVHCSFDTRLGEVEDPARVLDVQARDLDLVAQEQQLKIGLGGSLQRPERGVRDLRALRLVLIQGLLVPQRDAEHVTVAGAGRQPERAGAAAVVGGAVADLIDRRRGAGVDRDVRRRQQRQIGLAQGDLGRLQVAQIVLVVEVVGFDELDDLGELGAAEVIPPVRIGPDIGLVGHGALPVDRHNGHLETGDRCARAGAEHDNAGREQDVSRPQQNRFIH
jgi:hypothetical protein